MNLSEPLEGQLRKRVIRDLAECMARDVEKERFNNNGGLMDQLARLFTKGVPPLQDMQDEALLEQLMNYRLEDSWKYNKPKLPEGTAVVLVDPNAFRDALIVEYSVREIRDGANASA